MEHTVEIWSQRKERNDKGELGFFIESKVKLTDEDIEEMALQKFKDSQYSLNEDRVYSARLTETKHG